MLSQRAWREIGKALGTTGREIQVIQGVFDNLAEKGIASRLELNEHTVHTHLNRLFKKLNTTTRTELVLRVIEELISLTLGEEGVLPPICPRYQSGACLLSKLSARSRQKQV